MFIMCLVPMGTESQRQRFSADSTWTEIVNVTPGSGLCSKASTNRKDETVHISWCKFFLSHMSSFFST